MIAPKQDDPNTSPSLKRAYSDLLCEYDLGYWKSALLAKSLDEENLVDSGDSTDGINENGSLEMLSGKKRKRADYEVEGFRFPPTLRALEVGDEEDDDESQYVKREPEGGGAKYTFSKGVLDQDHSSLYDVSDTESRSKIKKTRLPSL